MSAILGLILIVGGILLALYVGIWLCFVDGIVDIINEIKADREVDAWAICWALIRISLADVIAVIIGVACVVAGAGFVSYSFKGENKEEAIDIQFPPEA